MDRFSVFAVMWAVALDVHLFNQELWPLPGWPLAAGDVAALATFGASVAVWMRPASATRLVVLAVLQLAHVAITLPNVADHWILAALVDLLVVWAALRLRRRGGHWPRGSELLAEFEAPARVVFLVCYSFAALAKWNATFFDPAGSCATHLLSLVRTFVPLIPDARWVDLAAIAGTLLAESASALLLLFPSLRLPGIVLCATFHFSISHTPGARVADFAATIFALLFLFTPEGFTERLRVFLRSLGPAARPPETGPRAWLRRLGPAGPLLPPALLVLGLVLTGRWELFLALAEVGNVLLFLAWGALAVVALFACVFGGGPPLRPRRKIFAFRSPAYAAVVLVGVLNGAAPYLGLKTQASFTMFSNLRTERGRENHLIVPGSVRLADFQSGYVGIVATSNPRVQAQIDAGRFRDRVVNLFDVKRLTAADPDASLVLLRDGAPWHVPRVGSDPELGEVPPFWLRKVMIFRSLPADGSAECVN